jgi:CubicO group peptidase (beta-lactamase class C family)
MNKFILLTLLFCLIVNNTKAQKTEFEDKFNEICKAYYDVYGFSGSVMVVQNDETVFKKSYGLANRSFGVINTPTTRTSINSISKTFTSALVLKLVEQELLQLHVPISNYLPVLTADWADKVTLHHLLSHTSGLPREVGLIPTDELNFEQQTLLVNSLKLMFSPGERFQYSNAGVILIGAILENISGKDFDVLINEEIIKPLGLLNTGVYQGKAVVKNQAVPYKIGPNGIEEAQRTKSLGASAGGGLYATLEDLYTFTKALEEEKILSRASQDLLFTKHIELSESESEGYTWSLKKFGEDQIRMAAGSGYGTKSVIIREPNSGLFIGILSNWGNTPILDILRDVYLTVKNQEITLPTVKNLADPERYSSQLGTYIFNADQMKTYLQAEDNRVKVRNIDGKLFMDDELLMNKGEGKLGLTYTDEVIIYFENNRLIIQINDNIMSGILYK